MLSDIYFCFQQVFKVCFGIEPIQGKPCKIACNSLQTLAKWQAEGPRTEAGHADNILNWVGPKQTNNVQNKPVICINSRKAVQNCLQFVINASKMAG